MFTMGNDTSIGHHDGGHVNSRQCHITPSTANAWLQNCHYRGISFYVLFFLIYYKCLQRDGANKGPRCLLGCKLVFLGIFLALIPCPTPLTSPSAVIMLPGTEAEAERRVHSPRALFELWVRFFYHFFALFLLSYSIIGYKCIHTESSSRQHVDNNYFFILYVHHYVYYIANKYAISAYSAYETCPT
jgi:magnesium-transporting ATPase (P-type)